MTVVGIYYIVYYVEKKEGTTRITGFISITLEIHILNSILELFLS